MKNPSPQVELINSNIELAKSHGVLQLNVDEIRGEGRTIRVNGQDLINFSSCSYLGLETDARLKQAGQAMIEDFGVHFSTSRSYAALSVYEELEDYLAEILNGPVIVTPSTTLGHMAALPLLVGQNDHLILDQQVHSSISFSARQVNLGPQNIERIRHNRMDYLENRLQKLCPVHDKVWYLADGVYSMFGDTAPLDELLELLNRYENFHLYIDDAHGMSWKGRHGRGVVAESIPHHPRMMLVTSLGKGFGTSGGAIVCQNEAQKQLIRNCGGTLIFSGPLQPANLGAAVVSAKIHLSDEIGDLQQQVQQRIDYFRMRCNQLDLPLVTEGNTPIFYIGLGKHEVSGPLCETLLREGFFTCISSFPTVSYNHTGLRILVNVHHDISDIERLLETTAHYLPAILTKAGYSLDEIYKAFRLQPN